MDKSDILLNSCKFIEMKSPQKKEEEEEERELDVPGPMLVMMGPLFCNVSVEQSFK